MSATHYCYWLTYFLYIPSISRSPQKVEICKIICKADKHLWHKCGLRLWVWDPSFLGHILSTPLPPLRTYIYIASTSGFSIFSLYRALNLYLKYLSDSILCRYIYVNTVRDTTWLDPGSRTFFVIENTRHRFTKFIFVSFVHVVIKFIVCDIKEYLDTDLMVKPEVPVLKHTLSQVCHTEVAAYRFGIDVSIPMWDCYSSNWW